MSSFIARNLKEIEAVAGCTFACISNTVFCMFTCSQINCQPFYLRQLLKFHPFDWMIEIYLQTEGQGTHHKMVSLQPMPGFPPLLPGPIIKKNMLKKLRKQKLGICRILFATDKYRILKKHLYNTKKNL